MKLREIFRFELSYQLLRLTTWLYFVVLAVVAWLFVRSNALGATLFDEYYVNAPFIIASATVFCGLLWFILAAAVAGEAGARDVETGMHPLAYTAPVGKAEYLGGRFLAAFVLNALILLAVPLGAMIAVYGSGVDPELIGPFRPATYLTAYGFITLPNVFIANAIQFSWAALSRRAIASYLGSVILFFVAYGGFVFVSFYVGRQDLGALLDIFGHIFITSDLVLGWTPMEKNTRLIALEGTLLWSRILWMSIALATLAFTYLRFRIEHPTTSPWWFRVAGRRDAHAPTPGGSDVRTSAISAPEVAQAFGFATSLRQVRAIGWTSFWTIAKSRGGLIVLAAIAGLVVMVMPQNMENMGTPLLPRTEHLLTFLTTALTNPITPWVVTPLLIVFFSGELVWREREAGLGEIVDAAPVRDWVVFLGRYLGLALVLVVWMGLLMLAGVLVQARMGYYHFEIGLYLQILFGLQLPQYLLFALLALVIQGLVNQKYIGHLLALLAYVFIAFADFIGVEHDLLVYGSAPAWTYTDMRGFGASLGPWRWFIFYWSAWALLLAVVARLLWVRGREVGQAARLQLARGRLTRPTAIAAALAGGLVLSSGGFIFYNTNVLNEYRTAADVMELRAEYERRYGRFAGIPQPRLTRTNLRVEIYPGRRELQVRGSYDLVNREGQPIDSIHVATVPGLGTGNLTFDRPGRLVVSDAVRGHHVYDLADPLPAGEAVRMGFAIHLEPRGFRNSGVDASVAENSTYFKNQWILPAIGYQTSRELFKPGDRRAHGLAPRPMIPLLAEAEGGQDITGEASQDSNGADRIAVEAVVGTDADQVAVGPGTLRRTWTEDGRRYFHFATDTPIGNEYAFFSARYAVHEEQWTGPAASAPSTLAVGSAPALSAAEESGSPASPRQTVAIQVYYHPRHAANLDRMLRSVRASLEHNIREYGPYPHSFIRLVENPGRGIGAHADATTIDYTEGFSLFDPGDDAGALDFPFAIMAHEMAHQWGVSYAFAEGAPLLSESFAWYAAMGVVEETYGRDHLERLRRFFRQPAPIPPIRQSVPLLRALDPYAAYRKGPFAFFAMGEYMGHERVNLAFRRLREKTMAGTPPQATTLDLYRELQAVTPDSLQYLLRDLFEVNTVWELATERAAAKQTEAGTWEVTLELRARKVAVEPSGVEIEVPMDEWIQIGVFAPTAPGSDFGETLYLREHRIRAGDQTITVLVPREPADAGIDPYLVLIDLERFDNVEEVDIER